MLKDIKYTIKNSAIYGLSRISTKLVSLILIPLYTTKFSSDAIANINLLESFWQYVFTLCMFALETAIVNFCAAEDSFSKRKKLLFNFFSILLINSILVFALGYLFSGQLSEFILKSSNFKVVIIYCLAISVFESLLIMPLTIARLNNKPILYSIIIVSNLLLNLFLQILFILYFKYNFDSIFIAKFIAPFILFVLFLPYTLKNLELNINFYDIKEIIKFSFPLMIASLVSILLNTFDRFILTDFVSDLNVAIYTIGYSLGSVANAFIAAPFTLAINVIFWNKIKDENIERFLTKSATYLYFVMILTSLIISFFLPYFIKIIVRNESLLASVDIVPYILFSNCISSLFVFFSLSFYYKRKTNRILLITSVCLIFNIVFNFIFIRYFGIYASAVLTIISYMLMVYLGYNLSKKLYRVKFEIYKLTLLSVLFVLIYFLAILLNLDVLYDIMLKILLIFLFVFILHILKFFEPIEIERIFGFFNKYIFQKIKFRK
ncbi:MAG: oligosaccharide flippase family protein [Bacteroidota bacterium]|nr:oligosaccharide flippase family protein [Bacteroidota bacterium]